MSRTAWIWTAIVAVIVIIGIIWLVNSGSSTPTAPTAETTSSGSTTTEQPAATSSANSTSPSATAGKTVTVSYDGTAFSPAKVEIAKGDTVAFVDQSSRGFWVASADHPTHTKYDGTSRSTHCAPGYAGQQPFDECSSGTNFSFTFNKAGTFNYHDHMNPSARGAVVVK